MSIGLSSICRDGDTAESCHVTSLLNAANSLLQRFRRCARSRDELQERWTVLFIYISLAYSCYHRTVAFVFIWFMVLWRS